jgi:hypothetical protein
MSHGRSLTSAPQLQRAPTAPATAVPLYPDGLFNQSRLSAVTRQQLRLVFGYLAELAFKGFGDFSVKGGRCSRSSVP